MAADDGGRAVAIAAAVGERPGTMSLNVRNH